MKLRLALAGAAIALLAGSAHAATFPAYGLDPSANIVITFGPGGAIGTVDNGYLPYDGTDDTYVGVVNNSGHTISSIHLSSAQPIGVFDGDGLAAYGAPTPYDPNGYGGPLGYFTNNTGFDLTVNFTGGVANSQSTYFSLESVVDIHQLGVPEPETWALLMIGMGAIGFAARRRAKMTAVAA